MKTPKFISSLASRCNDAANPVMVKELYQAVNGKLTTGTLLLFLLIQVLVMIIPISLTENIESSAIGREIFMGNNCVLLITCMIIIPLLVGLRFRKERSEQNLDLMFITALSPARVIRGKWLAGLAFVLLIYSVCAPFMSLTWLLRGVGLDLIIFTLVIGFMCSALCLYFVLVVEAIPANRFLSGLKFLGSLGGLILAFAVAQAFMGEYAFFGRNMTIEAWAWIIGLFLAAMLLCKLAATALISPRTYNITLPLKIWLTIAWAAGMILAYLYVQALKDDNIIEAWAAVTIIVLSISMFLSIFYPPIPSMRVRGQIPRNILTRILVFPFYHTLFSGILWSWLLLIVTFVVGYCVGTIWGKSYRWVETLRALMIIPVYIYCYAMTAMLIAQVFAKRHDVIVIIRVLLLLIAVAIFLPILAGIMFIGIDVYDHDSIFMITNPFMPLISVESWYGNHSLVMYEVFVIAWTIIVSLLAAPMAIASIYHFQPLPKQEPVTQNA